MSSQSTSTSELLSALADGQVNGAEFGTAMDMLGRDARARADWQAYHLVGEALRQPDLLAHAGDGGFVARFQARLAAEAPLSVASQPQAQPQGEPAVAVVAAPQRPSANDGRWKLVAGLASFVAVAALSWTAMAPRPPGSGEATPLLAQGSAPAQAAGGQTVAVAGPGRQVMIRDPRLDQLLAAHKQFGGTSALQMPAGFLRNATYEEPTR